jgi:hypothetical protein
VLLKIKLLSLFPITRELSKKRCKGNDFLFIKKQSDAYFSQNSMRNTEILTTFAALKLSSLRQ